MPDDHQHPYRPKTIEEWTHLGYECKITQVAGHYNGYVTAEFTKNLTDNELMSDLDVTVYGGITYGPNDEGTVGFDCCHPGAVCYDEDGNRLDVAYFGMPLWPEATPYGRKFTPEIVKDEVQSLAGQLDAIERAWPKEQIEE